ncbi:hypothetical protein HZB78_05800 [Candidatus Collierbacteria bacterium]|nr:hypothetical protein [Candidatus Collierbacteria bacterium]
MNTAVYPIRTQISLSPELRKLIEMRGAVLNEGLSEYLRRAAVLRMAVDDVERNDLKLIAQTVVGSIPKFKSGWKNVKNIGEWQRKSRKDEDQHRS